MGFWPVGTPHCGGSTGGAEVDVVVVCGIAIMLPQLETKRASATPPSIRLNRVITTLPRLLRGRYLLASDLLQCSPSNTDRQSFVRDLPMSSYFSAPTLSHT